MKISQTNGCNKEDWETYTQRAISLAIKNHLKLSVISKSCGIINTANYEIKIDKKKLVIHKKYYEDNFTY